MSNQQTTNAIAFTRVAIPTISASGVSITMQDESIQAIAKQLETSLVESFDFCGSTRNTPFRAMFDYCKSNGTIRYLICYHPDRIARNLEVYYYWKKMFSDLGVEIVFSKPSNIKGSNLEATLMETMCIAMAEFDFSIRSQHIKAGLAKARALKD